MRVVPVGVRQSFTRIRLGSVVPPGRYEMWCGLKPEFSRFTRSSISFTNVLECGFYWGSYMWQVHAGCSVFSYQSDGVQIKPQASSTASV